MLQQLTVDARTFRVALGRAYHAARPGDKDTLAGAYLRTLGATLEVATTDNHRLAVVRVPIGSGQYEGRLPDQLVDRIRASKHKGAMTLTEQYGIVTARAGEEEWTGIVPQYRYPAYEAHVDKTASWPHQASIRRAHLAYTVGRCPALATTRVDYVILTMRPARITIEPDNIAADVVPAIIAHESLQQDRALVRIRMDWRYLRSAVGALRGQVTTLRWRGPRDALVFEDGTMRILVMPVE